MSLTHHWCRRLVSEPLLTLRRRFAAKNWYHSFENYSSRDDHGGWNRITRLLQYERRPRGYHCLTSCFAGLIDTISSARAANLATTAEQTPKTVPDKSPEETVVLAELQRDLDAPDLALEDSIDTGRGVSAQRDAAFTARLLQYLVRRYQGRVHPKPLALTKTSTVQDLINLFAELDREDAIRKARDPVAWRAWKLEQLFGVSNEADIPPNVSIDPRLRPEKPLPRKVPYTRRKIRERLSKVMESARQSPTRPTEQ
ncbi:hypothetical protein CCYA_CCYA07G2169 [Cyanidiococcus yangmingshanensis]|nr:hypothetical protein CCYA_CCYA07G2169 [Cyanidiococcus yangmingshanensis]